METAFSKRDSQIIKGIAVCLLVWHHLFGSEGDITGNGIRLHFLSVHQMANAGTAARICVWFFIFISCYGWTVIYGRKAAERGTFPAGKDVRGFLKERYLKLMQPFWFTYIVFLLLSFFIFTYAVRRYAAHPLLYAALDFLGIADLFGTPMLAGIWWYMTLAQLMLFVIPFVIHAADLFGAFLIPVTYVFVRITGVGITSNYGGEYSRYACMIVLGVLMARYNLFEKLARKLAEAGKSGFFARRFFGKLFPLISLAAAAVLTYLDYKYIYPDDRWSIFGFILGFAALLFITAVRFMPRVSFLENVFLFFGEHSGNIFLVHGFLLVRFRNALYASGNAFFTWLTLMAGSIVLSYMLIWLRQAAAYARNRFSLRV